MKTIGLTGGIACGKSSVAKILGHLPHIDADQVAREVVSPGSPGLARVREAFGDGIITEEGGLDRPRLRHIIAHDDEARSKLNGILHPLIQAAMMEKVHALRDQGEPACLVSAALMMETGSYERYDAVILVTAPVETRLARLLARDEMDEASARKLIASQWPDERRRPLADVEIINDSDYETLIKRTQAAAAALGI
jgi:dephospho-CoA kinase